MAVLSSWFGGAYFGGILAGIAEATQAGGGRLLAIQTLDAGTYGTDLSAPSDFRLPVAKDRATGFVVILDAVHHDHLRALEATGKPVVIISSVVPGFSGSVVLPDNRGGVRTAVEHLLEHGHRRIAFAGFPFQRDLAERYEAYRETLLDHGITPDPALFYDTGNSQQSGGRLAAEAMLAAGLPGTAVVCGNDNNAIGVMHTLLAAGLELPRDQAIIGFDDLDAAAYLSPSLSSVRQSLEGIGRQATELLFERLAGQRAGPDLHHAPTVLITRESCGCPSRLTLAGSLTPSAPSGSESAPGGVGGSRAELSGQVVAALTAGSGRTLHDHRAVTAGLDAIFDRLDAAAAGDPTTGGPDPEPGGLQRSLDELYAQALNAESLVQVMRGTRDYAAHLLETAVPADDARGRQRVDDVLKEMLLALARAELRARYAQEAHFEATFTSQHRVSMHLLRGSHGDDPRGFEWLRGTPAKGACLGLWEQGSSSTPGGRRLEIAGSFRATPDDPPFPPGVTPVELFPPAELLDLADLAAGDMVYIAPMRVHASDWGVLAVAGPIEETRITGREIMNQWAALLTSALDHRAVLKELRRQGKRLRRQKEELHRQKDELRHAATHDELTGLPNRVLFFEGLREAIARSKRHGRDRFGILLLDLDGFKNVNDTLGHSVGDQLLVQAARRISTSVRVTDLAARLGGDEFAVLLDHLTEPLEVALGSARRLRAALSTPFVIDGRAVVIGASIGVAFSDDRYELPEELLRDADVAMYWAKNREKGTHAVFEPAMLDQDGDQDGDPGGDQDGDRRHLEAELRRALEREEFELAFAPVVDLLTGRTTTVEASVGWRHPERGLLPPEEFLAAAEECGLRLPIEQWALPAACGQLARWRDAGVPADLRLSLDVSPQHFWHGGLVDDVRSALRTARLDARHLCLEITEGVVRRDVEAARRILDELGALGVEFHLAGFGTGQSSFEAVQTLPVGVLKLHPSFLPTAGTADRSWEIVRAMIAMADALGITVVAEGVGSREHVDRLRALGCHRGQGRWFAPPVPASAVPDLVAGAPWLLAAHAVPRQERSPR